MSAILLLFLAVCDGIEASNLDNAAAVARRKRGVAVSMAEITV